MARALNLGVVLLGLWLVLSGMLDEPLLIGLGLVSVAFVTYVSVRMDVADHEGDSIHMHIRFLRYYLYWAWLIGEIFKSSVDVTRRVLSPRMPISPTVFRVKTTQRTEMGLVNYANSITRTPGTVSIHVQPGEIEVHALSREAAEELMNGEMDRRVSALEVID